MSEPLAGQGGTGENFSKSSYTIRGVSGLVRKVSLKVVNMNKGEVYIIMI